MSKKIMVVKGIDHNGVGFRPSDWVERLASCVASFTAENRLSWHQGLKPVYIENEKCLAINAELESIHPAIWNHVINFVSTNNLQIQENINEINTVIPEFDTTVAA